MIKVMLIDKDPESLEEIKQLFYDADGFLVMAETTKPKLEMLRMADHLKPDLILINHNVNLPEHASLVKSVLLNRKLPVFIVHGEGELVNREAVNQVIALGALAALEISYPAPEDFFSSLRALIEVPLVKRSKRISSYESGREKKSLLERKSARGSRIIGIGSSTGGPKTLEKILRQVKPGFQVPIVVVQHISSGFTDGLVDWLNGLCDFQIQIVKDKEVLAPGKVYFAPDGSHLTLHRMNPDIIKNTKSNADQPWFVRLVQGPEINGVKPSVDAFFESMAPICGAGGLGILLSGMGKDGASGLRMLHDNDATTLVQDKESSVIWGMPGAAVALNAADRVLSIADIAAEINAFGNFED